MLKQNIKDKFNDLIYSLNIKYNLYFNNHQYKDSYFKSKDEYESIQKNLSKEIQQCENDLEDILTIFIQSFFADAKIIAYDSRFLCVANKKEHLGNLLMTNINEEEADKIKSEIKEYFEFNVNVELLENLPENFKNMFKLKR